MKEASKLDFDAGRAYRLLFNTITDAVIKLDAGKPQEAKRILIWCQRAVEDQYITAPNRFMKMVAFPGRKRKQQAGGRQPRKRRRKDNSKLLQSEPISMVGKSQDC